VSAMGGGSGQSSNEGKHQGGGCLRGRAYVSVNRVLERARGLGGRANRPRLFSETGS
jgi:hypothetical protein